MNQVLSFVTAHVMSFINSWGYEAIAICMALESCNLPIPSEVILPFGGYLASTGRIDFWGSVLAGTLGGTLGSLASYYLGYLAIDRLLSRWVSPNKMEEANRLFARYGEATVFFARLVPMVRTFISLPAGFAKMDLAKFLFYTFLGSAIWSTLLTYVGFVMGENWDIIRLYMRQADVVIAAGLILLVCALYWEKKRHAGNRT